MTLLICRTCPRYEPHHTGEFGQNMAHEVIREIARTAATPIAVRNVQCLGGCPEDGVVAVDGPGKARVRFNSVAPGDAAAIITATAAHDASLTGDPTEWEIPSTLVDRLSTVTYKRPPVSR